MGSNYRHAFARERFGDPRPFVESLRMIAQPRRPFALENVDLDGRECTSEVDARRRCRRDQALQYAPPACAEVALQRDEVTYARFATIGERTSLVPFSRAFRDVLAMERHRDERRKTPA